MRQHSTPRFHELTAQSGGKNPTLTPASNAIQTAIFDVKGVPTGSKGKFWYYCLGAVIKAIVTIDQAASGGAAVNADKLWKCFASFSWFSPILGDLFAHRNTRGAVVGNIIMPFARGFNAPPARAQIASGDGDTVATLAYKLPLAYSFLTKPHETAPWSGFLEGGQIECKLDLSTVLDTDSTGMVLKATTSVRCHLQLIPSPEPVVHVPVNWREFTLPGSTTRHLFPDLGSPDGLQGIDTAHGIGMAALLYLTDATGIGLSGADGVDNITSYDVPFRDQARIDDVAAPFNWWLESLEKRPGQRAGNGTTIVADDGGWPYTLAATPNGDVMNSQALFYPIVAPSRNFETSKMQTVRGPQEVNFGYTSTPSGSARFVVMQFMKFKSEFAKGLLDLLLGYDSEAAGALLAPKTVNKNDPSNIHTMNPKLAYTRLKGYLPGLAK